LGSMVGGAGSLAQAAFLAPYSREQEREADRVGQEIVAHAGYDPAALSAALHTLEREEALQGASGGTSFLSTHPSTPERVATTAAYARELGPVSRRPIAGSRAAFLGHLDGLVVGPDARDGVFLGTLFLQPDLDFAVRFPDGWKTGDSPVAVAASAPDGSAV